MRYCLALLVLLCSSSSWGVIETYQFDDEILRARYQIFTQELRCPKCQNQNLSGSNSPIAEDLRRELHRLLHEGASDQQITDFMVARYGEFVLYRPRLQPQTLVLWFAPAVFLVVGVFVIIVLVRRQRLRLAEGQQHGGGSAQNENLSAGEQKAITELLNKGRQDD